MIAAGTRVCAITRIDKLGHDKPIAPGSRGSVVESTSGVMWVLVRWDRGAISDRAIRWHVAASDIRLLTAHERAAEMASAP